jgi:hypothetical protein
VTARPCSECGDAFTPRRKSTATLCSAKCRKRVQRRRDKSAMLRREEAAVGLIKAGDLDPWDALLMVVAPSPAVRAASMRTQAA